jgi:hypothetical protein
VGLGRPAIAPPIAAPAAVIVSLAPALMVNT